AGRQIGIGFLARQDLKIIRQKFVDGRRPKGQPLMEDIHQSLWLLWGGYSQSHVLSFACHRLARRCLTCSQKQAMIGPLSASCMIDKGARGPARTNRAFMI